MKGWSKIRDRRGPLKRLVCGRLCRVIYQMCLNVIGQALPGGREGEQDAVASGAAGIAMSSMKQPVIDRHGVSRSQAERDLIRQVAHRGMSWRNGFSSQTV